MFKGLDFKYNNRAEIMPYFVRQISRKRYTSLEGNTILIIKRSLKWFLFILIFLIIIRILYVAGYIGLVHLDLNYFNKISFEGVAKVIEKPRHSIIINEKEDGKNTMDAIIPIGISCLVQWEDGKIEKITLPSKEILKINTLLKIKGEKTYIFGLTSVNNFQIINTESTN